MREVDVTFASRDGYALSGTVFVPDSPCCAILISSATAYAKRFYAPIAQYLAAKGAIVLTYDYRGIGRSRSGPLADDPTRMQDWIDDGQLPPVAP